MFLARMAELSALFLWQEPEQEDTPLKDFFDTWKFKILVAVAVYEGEFAGALFGAVGGLLWDYTAGRTVGMLALELLLLCFALSVLVQVYLQGSTWNFALIGTGTALVVLSLDWLFFYYMPGYSWALSRWLTFVLPSAVMTLVPSLVLFSLVRRIYNEFKIDNGVI